MGGVKTSKQQPIVFFYTVHIGAADSHCKHGVACLLLASHKGWPDPPTFLGWDMVIAKRMAQYVKI
jgi:hypothetical protein